MSLPDDRSSLVRRLAEGVGFDLVGIAPAVSPPGYGHFLDWLDAGKGAGLEYLHRHAGARSHPEHVLPGVRSVVMVGLSYNPIAPDPAESPRSGKVARYARGRDYHKVLWKRLGRLGDRLTSEFPDAHVRAVADTAPLLERDFARLAGLGWIAKNTMLISRSVGSYTVLGALLTDLDLEPDAPFEADHCGSCTRCLDACPTGAFDGPYRLDSNRCISNWTIEHRGELPESAADSLHGWLFGCDVCQEVCPWNRKAPPGRDPELQADPSRIAPDLIALLEADDEAIADLIRGSAMTRAKRAGLIRNAAALVASSGVREAVPALNARLSDEDPVVRASCARALARLVGAADGAARRDGPG
jgi:epoxyqueuosine reductase